MQTKMNLIKSKRKKKKSNSLAAKCWVKKQILFT